MTPAASRPSPSTDAGQPVLMMTASTSRSCSAAVPGHPGDPHRTARPVPARAAAPAGSRDTRVRMPTWTSTACATKLSCTVREMSSSIDSRMRGATSSSVTCAPSAWKTVTSWAPVLPAPTTASRRGTSGMSSTCSGSRASSAPGTGRRRECPPTHSTTASPRTRRPLSDSSMVCGSTNRARPSRTRSTPSSARCSGSALTSWIRSMTARTRATVVAQSTTGSPTSMP